MKSLGFKHTIVVPSLKHMSFKKLQTLILYFCIWLRWPKTVPPAFVDGMQIEPLQVHLPRCLCELVCKPGGIKHGKVKSAQSVWHYGSGGKIIHNDMNGGVIFPSPATRIDHKPKAKRDGETCPSELIS